MTDIDKSQNSKAGGEKPKFEIKDTETGKVYYSKGLDSTYDIIRVITPEVSKYRVRMALSRGDPVADGRFEIRRLDGKTSLSKIAKQPIPGKQMRKLKIKRKNKKSPPSQKAAPDAAPVGSPVTAAVNVAQAAGLAPAKVVVAPHDKGAVVQPAKTGAAETVPVLEDTAGTNDSPADASNQDPVSQQSPPSPNGSSASSDVSTTGSSYMTPVSTIGAQTVTNEPNSTGSQDEDDNDQSEAAADDQNQTLADRLKIAVEYHNDALEAQRRYRMFEVQNQDTSAGIVKNRIAESVWGTILKNTPKEDIQKEFDAGNLTEYQYEKLKEMKDIRNDIFRQIGKGSGDVQLEGDISTAVIAEKIASIATRAKELALDPGVKATQGARMAKLLEAVEAKDYDEASKLMNVIEEHSSDYNLRNAEKDAEEQAQLESAGTTGVDATMTDDSGISDSESATLVAVLEVAYKSIYEKLTGNADVQPNIEQGIRTNAAAFKTLVTDGGAGSKDVDTKGFIAALANYVGANDPVVVASKEDGKEVNDTVKVSAELGVLSGAGPVDDALQRRVELATSKLENVTDAIKEKEVRMGYTLDQPSDLTDATVAEENGASEGAMEGSGLLDSAYKTYPENTPYSVSSAGLEEERMALSFSRKRHLQHGMRESKGKVSRRGDYENFRRPEPKNEPNRIHDNSRPVLPYGHPGTVLSRNRPGEPMLQRPYYRTDLVANAPRRGQSQNVIGDLAVTGSLPFAGNPRGAASREPPFRYQPAPGGNPNAMVDTMNGNVIAGFEGQNPVVEPGMGGNGMAIPYGGYGFNPDRGARRFYEGMVDDDAILRGRGRRSKEAKSMVDSVRAQKPRRDGIPGASRSSHAPRQDFGQYIGMPVEDVADMLNTEGWGIRVEHATGRYTSNYVKNRIRVKVDDYGTVVSLVQG